MTTKHTPGPWTTDEAEHDSPYQNIRIGNVMHHTVCSVWIDDAPVHDFNAKQRANARLIAAAPELLSIARRVSEWERKYPAHRIYSEGETRSIAAEMTAIVKDADSAIAKATGETQ